MLTIFGPSRSSQKDDSPEPLETPSHVPYGLPEGAISAAGRVQTLLSYSVNLVSSTSCMPVSMDRIELQRIPSKSNHHDSTQLEPISVTHDAILENLNDSDALHNHNEPHEAVDVLEMEEEIRQPRTKIRLMAVLAALFVSPSLYKFADRCANDAPNAKATLFVAALNDTIIATAIPTISSQLHSASGYTWIGGAYLLANAAAGPVWVKLSDIWGRKPILLTAVASFAVGSVFCALSESMQMLIAGRALQGTAGGGLIEMVHITISDLFSMRKRSLYLGLLECMWAVAGGIGPTLGGVLTQSASWRWIFWINLPIAGTTFLLLFLFLDVHNPRTNVIKGIKAIDWFGSISILGVTLMVLLGLNFGGVIFPWKSPKVICLIVFGFLTSIFFVYSEKRLARYPLMPLRMFSRRSNIASLLVCFLHSFVFIGGEYYLPLYFQSVKQASPLRSGVLVLPLTLAQAIMGLTTGILIHKTGRYLEMIWVGTLIMTLGSGLYIKFNTFSSVGEIVGLEFLAGIGVGLLFEPPLIALQSMIPQDDTATATGTFGFIRNLGTAFSIIVGGVIFQNSMVLRAPELLAAGLPANITQTFGADAAANVFLIGMIDDAQKNLAVREAYAWSLRNLWVLYTGVSALTAVAGVFIAKNSLSNEHVETKTGIKN